MMISISGYDAHQHFDDNETTRLAMPSTPIKVFLCHPHMLVGGNDDVKVFEKPKYHTSF
jgi:alpha/beta superfamily hydrolase